MHLDNLCRIDLNHFVLHLVFHTLLQVLQVPLFQNLTQICLLLLLLLLEAIDKERVNLNWETLLFFSVVEI